MYFSIFRRVNFHSNRKKINPFLNAFTNRLSLEKLLYLCDETPCKSLNDTSNLRSLLENSAAFGDESSITNEWSTPVYPVLTSKSHACHSIRPQIDPTKTSVLLYPGQGTQYVGMTKDLVTYPNVQQMFDSASEILKYDLLDMCLNGPEDMLNMTSYCQPAVFIASLAAVEKLRHDAPLVIETCVATAGFSVGEYTALVFAGALQFTDAVRLLKLRGEAMQAASELRPSGMMSVFLRPEANINQACAAAREWCASRNIEDPECKVAAYLLPDCKALKFLEVNAAELHIKKLKYMPVSGAFHSQLMRPARAVVAKALRSVSIQPPLIPVHSNVDGKPHARPDTIRANLAKQLCSPVAWEQTMHVIFERTADTPFPHTFECGPGQTLKVLLKHNNAKAHARCSSIKA